MKLCRRYDMCYVVSFVCLLFWASSCGGGGELKEEVAENNVQENNSQNNDSQNNDSQNNENNESDAFAMEADQQNDLFAQQGGNEGQANNEEENEGQNNENQEQENYNQNSLCSLL